MKANRRLEGSLLEWFCGQHPSRWRALDSMSRAQREGRRPCHTHTSAMEKYRLDGDRVFVIRGFLTPEECRSFVEESERAGYEDATISTASGAVMAKHIRDNARLVVDNSSLAAEWWRRAERFLPQHIERWRAVGLNERFRFYRYEPGQRFAPHFDGFSIERMENAAS